MPNLNGGGAEKVAVNIANGLVEGDVKVSLLIVQNRGVYFNNLRSEVSLIRMDYRKVIYSVFGVVRVIRDLNPDVIFSTTHRMNYVVYLCKYFCL